MHLLDALRAYFRAMSMSEVSEQSKFLTREPHLFLFETSANQSFANQFCPPRQLMDVPWRGSASFTPSLSSLRLIFCRVT